MINNSSSKQNRNDMPVNSRPVIVSVMSGKGGVGKSTVSYNLARVLSVNDKVLLIDCDLLFGDLHIIANCMPGCTIDQFLNSDNTPDNISANLSFVGAQSDGVEDQNIASDKLISQLKYLPNIVSEYDYVVIDTGSGSLEAIIEIARISDIRLILLNPELTAISDSYGLLKYMKLKDVKGQFCQLPNRCESIEDAEYIHDKFAEICKIFLKIRPDYFGYINENQHLNDKLKVGRDKIERPDSNSPTDDFKALVDTIRSLKSPNKKTNNINRLQAVNSELFAADIKG